MKRTPIRPGDTFDDGLTVWTVTECLGFGRGYWVVNTECTRLTIFHRNMLDGMQRTGRE